MLRLQCNDVVFIHLVIVRYSLDGNVIGLRGTTGEEDLFRTRPN